MTYNHEYTLDDFQAELDIIKEHGFNPIGVTQMYLEPTFIFETDKEAKDAYKKLERGNGIDEPLVYGWWYGKDKFKHEQIEYDVHGNGVKLLIYWLN